MEQLQLALGRGLAAFSDLQQRIEEARLVAAIAIERGTAGQAGATERRAAPPTLLPGKASTATSSTVPQVPHSGQRSDTSLYSR